MTVTSTKKVHRIKLKEPRKQSGDRWTENTGSMVNILWKAQKAEEKKVSGL